MSCLSRYRVINIIEYALVPLLQYIIKNIQRASILCTYTRRSYSVDKKCHYSTGCQCRYRHYSLGDHNHIVPPPPHPGDCCHTDCLLEQSNRFLCEWVEEGVCGCVCMGGACGDRVWVCGCRCGGRRVHVVVDVGV